MQLLSVSDYIKITIVRYLPLRNELKAIKTTTIYNWNINATTICISLNGERFSGCKISQSDFNIPYII